MTSKKQIYMWSDDQQYYSGEGCHSEEEAIQDALKNIYMLSVDDTIWVSPMQRIPFPDLEEFFHTDDLIESANDHMFDSVCPWIEEDFLQPTEQQRKHLTFLLKSAWKAWCVEYHSKMKKTFYEASAPKKITITAEMLEETKE